MNIKRGIRVQWLRLLKRTGSVSDKIFPAQSLSENQKRGIKIFEKAIKAIKEHNLYFIEDNFKSQPNLFQY